MKTVKNVKTGELSRVRDDEASKLVATEKYKYVPKSEWKNFNSAIENIERKVNERL